MKNCSGPKRNLKIGIRTNRKIFKEQKEIIIR